MQQKVYRTKRNQCIPEFLVFLRSRKIAEGLDFEILYCSVFFGYLVLWFIAFWLQKKRRNKKGVMQGFALSVKTVVDL